MSGLIAKDFALVTKRKMFFLIMLMFGYIIGVMGANDFVVGYITMLGAMYSFSTVSYDDADNGLAFLMTMPINTKIYVIEKFIFIFFNTVIFWVVGFAFYFLGCIYNGMEMGELGAYLLFIPLGMIMIAFCLPLQLKFGAEKSRIILILFVGLAFAVIYSYENIIASENVIETLSNTPDMVITGIIYLIMLISILVSGFFSVRVLNKKEY